MKRTFWRRKVQNTIHLSDNIQSSTAISLPITTCKTGPRSLNNILTWPESHICWRNWSGAVAVIFLILLEDSFLVLFRISPSSQCNKLFKEKFLDPLEFRFIVCSCSHQLASNLISFNSHGFQTSTSSKEQEH